MKLDDDQKQRCRLSRSFRALKECAGVEKVIDWTPEVA